jgi:hypothetical protein
MEFVGIHDSPYVHSGRVERRPIVGGTADARVRIAALGRLATVAVVALLGG